MIAVVQGQVFSVQSDAAIILCGGVGYELMCSQSTLAEIMDHKIQNRQVTLHAYTHVTQDSLQLFGFIDGQEKTLFESLIKVNGVGAKTAIQILSGASLAQLQQMIESEDVKALSKLPKVGKKTAEQMILTLKGKLVLAEDKKNPKTIQSKIKVEIGSALINLGFRSQDVDKVVAGLPESIQIEEGIRQGLASLTSV